MEMTPRADHISNLISLYLHDELSHQQKEVLDLWILQSERHKQLFKFVTEGQETAEALRTLYNYDNNRIEQLIKQEFPAKEWLIPASKSHVQAARRVHFLRTAWFRYAAAVILFIGLGAYLWSIQKTPTAITQTKPVPVENDILPGNDRAVLTLGDGEQVQLDSQASAMLAQKGISNVNALLVYKGSIAAGVVNTLATPKGGQYKIRLHDGTMVWLNAASSITYPTAFDGKMREVKVTGEVYFEVAADKKRPFVVNTEKERVTVLGTSFNINRYSDEPSGKISLISGAVKVNDVILQPGQAYVEGKVVQTNTSQDVAWKDGVFNFNDQQLVQVMRQIARWYDVDIVYRGTPANVEFVGKLSRTVSLSEVVEFFNRWDINMRLEGKKIIVNQ